MARQSDDRTPPELREGVKAGILASIEQDVEHRGGRTARLLAAAGVLGVAGAVGVTALVSAHPFGQRPSWHVTLVSSVWAGLLIVSLATVFLGLRTPRHSLAHAASVGIVGLGLAGICGAICPDGHFLNWWSSTTVGASIAARGGVVLTATCFGLVATIAIGAVSVLLAWRARRVPVRPLLPAAALVLMLAPAVALQSVGASWSVFVGWLAGTAAGAYAGVVVGVGLGNRLEDRLGRDRV